MTRKVGIALAVATLFTLGNAVSAGFASANGEGVHAGAHLVLMVVGSWLTWLAARRAIRDEYSADATHDPQVEQLQQSVDAIAYEVERLGEAQRFGERVREQPRAPHREPEGTPPRRV